MKQKNQSIPKNNQCSLKNTYLKNKLMSKSKTQLLVKQFNYNNEYNDDNDNDKSSSFPLQHHDINENNFFINQKSQLSSNNVIHSNHSFKDYKNINSKINEESLKSSKKSVGNNVDNEISSNSNINCAYLNNDNTRNTISCDNRLEDSSYSYYDYFENNNNNNNNDTKEGTKKVNKSNKNITSFIKKLNSSSMNRNKNSTNTKIVIKENTNKNCNNNNIDNDKKHKLALKCFNECITWSMIIEKTHVCSKQQELSQSSHSNSFNYKKDNKRVSMKQPQQVESKSSSRKLSLNCANSVSYITKTNFKSNAGVFLENQNSVFTKDRFSMSLLNSSSRGNTKNNYTNLYFGNSNESLGLRDIVNHNSNNYSVLENYENLKIKIPLEIYNSQEINNTSLINKDNKDNICNSNSNNNTNVNSNIKSNYLVNSKAINNNYSTIKSSSYNNSFVVEHQLDNFFDIKEITKEENINNTYFMFKLNGKVKCQEETDTHTNTNNINNNNNSNYSNIRKQSNSSSNSINKHEIFKNSFKVRLEGNAIIATIYKKVEAIISKITQEYLDYIREKKNNENNIGSFGNNNNIITYQEFFLNTLNPFTSNKLNISVTRISNNRSIGVSLSYNKLIKITEELKLAHKQYDSSNDTTLSSVLVSLFNEINSFIKKREDNLILLSKSYISKFLNNNDSIKKIIDRILKEIEIVSLITEVRCDSYIENDSNNTNIVNNDSLSTSYITCSELNEDFEFNNLNNYSNIKQEDLINKLSFKDISMGFKKTHSENNYNANITNNTNTNANNINTTDTYAYNNEFDSASSKNLTYQGLKKNKSSVDYIPLSERKKSGLNNSNIINNTNTNLVVNLGVNKAINNNIKVGIAASSYKTYCNFSILQNSLSPLIRQDNENKRLTKLDLSTLCSLYEESSYDGIDVVVFNGDASSKSLYNNSCLYSDLRTSKYTFFPSLSSLSITIKANKDIFTKIIKEIAKYSNSTNEMISISSEDNNALFKDLNVSYSNSEIKIVSLLANRLTIEIIQAHKSSNNHKNDDKDCIINVTYKEKLPLHLRKPFTDQVSEIIEILEILKLDIYSSNSISNNNTNNVYTSVEDFYTVLWTATKSQEKSSLLFYHYLNQQTRINNNSLFPHRYNNNDSNTSNSNNSISNIETISPKLIGIIPVKFNDNIWNLNNSVYAQMNIPSLLIQNSSSVLSIIPDSLLQSTYDFDLYMRS